MRERLIVRVSEEELKRWRQQAFLAGAPSLSAFVRDGMNGGAAARPVDRAAEPAPDSFQTEPDWLAVIKRIGARTPP